MKKNEYCHLPEEGILSWPSHTILSLLSEETTAPASILGVPLIVNRLLTLIIDATKLITSSENADRKNLEPAGHRILDRRRVKTSDLSRGNSLYSEGK